jgi:hypothetical protein
VGGEGILNVTQMNIFRILRKIPNPQVTLMSVIAWVVVYSVLEKRNSLPNVPIIAEEVFWKRGGAYSYGI